MKPIKPKKLSKALRVALTNRAERTESTEHMTPAAAAREIRDRYEARAILAALEYERQRADEALDFIAEHAKDFGGTPRGQSFDIFLTKHGRQRAALTWDEREAMRRGRG